MTPPEGRKPNPDEMALAKAKAELGARSQPPIPRPNPLASEEEVVSKYTQGRFALILNELDLRSRKSNKWLTALSLIYVVVVLAIVLALFYQYSALERMIGELDEDLKATGEAIKKQAEHHEEQSAAISSRISATDQVLDGVSKEATELEVKLDLGMEKAIELSSQSDKLEARIEEFDEVTESLNKYAQPFSVQYSVDSSSPQDFEPEKVQKVKFSKFISLSGAQGGEVAKPDGGFAVPTGGTYVVAGWFSTRVKGALINDNCVVETEVRVDESPVWKGVARANGTFTVAVPLQEGQVISLYATMRFQGDSEAKEGTIESGDIRISRVGYLP